MKKILIPFLVLIFATSCGDNDNNGRSKFNPETDWVQINVSDQLDIYSELSKLADLYFTDEESCDPGFTCVTPIDPGQGPFFRNVVIKGDITTIDKAPGWHYSEIYNLDMSGTKVEKMLYAVIPTKAKWVALPETLTDLCAAFSGCTYLEEMVIPKNVDTVYDYNFEKLSSLKRVVSEAATPPNLLYACESGSMPDVFPKIFPSPNWTLTVPAGSKAAYENHEWWGLFSSITEK